MRFLIDARPMTDGRPGGVHRVTHALISALIEAESSHELLCVTSGLRPFHSDLFNGVPHTTHIHLRTPNKFLSTAYLLGSTSLDRALEKRAGKINASFLPNLGFTGVLRRPYLLLLHDLSFLIEPRWFTPRYRIWHRAINAKRLIKNATHLLSVSEHTKQDAMRLLGIPESHITVIPMGATAPLSFCHSRESGNPATPEPLDSRFRGNDRNESPIHHSPLRLRSGQAFVIRHSSFSIHSPYILALGGNDPRKNIATAVATVRALREDAAWKDLKLVVIGHSNLCHFERSEKSPWILPLPRVSDQDLADLYRNASAFLYPSWYEGYGLPLHEAASYETPCVASTTGALPETAPTGTLFADPAKPHHWIEATRIALAQPRAPSPTRPDRDWTEAARIIRTTLEKIGNV